MSKNITLFVFHPQFFPRFKALIERDVWCPRVEVCNQVFDLGASIFGHSSATAGYIPTAVAACTKIHFYGSSMSLSISP